MRLLREMTFEPLKVVRTCGIFNIWFRNLLRTTTHVFFRYLNFQKYSEHEIFFAFSFANVFRATTACNFPFLICPTGFISHLPSWLRTRRFSEPTFRLSGGRNYWKKRVLRDFPTFSRTLIFFFLRFSLFDLLSSALLFSDSSHFCFSSIHIVEKLISKFPSNIW